MIVRALAVWMLLHHIEGVCKPWSAVKQAAGELVAGFVRQTVGDQAADVERAREWQQEGIQRARLRGAARTAGRALRGRQTARTAIEQRRVAGWTEQVAETMREGQQ